MILTKMRQPKTFNIIFITFLICSLILTNKIHTANTSGTIYIHADGLIDPHDAPISTIDNITYTCTSDIYEPIIVEKSAITIDGNGFKLQGTGSGTGLYLTTTTNIIVQNMKITQFRVGVYASSAVNITLTNNTIIGPSHPPDWNGNGIHLEGQGNNAINENYISHNQRGVFIYGPGGNNKISNNIFMTNLHAILLGSQCDNNTINDNLFTNNTDGIHLDMSQNNLIKNNIIIGNIGSGIYLDPVGNGYNTIHDNNITNNGHGIFSALPYRGNNMIINNFIASSTRVGIRLDNSQGNKIYHNDLVNNTKQVTVSSVANFWDNDIEGNYWSNYTDVDSNHDGIGDSPYIINAYNQDNYPLMNPYIPGDYNHDATVNIADAEMVRTAWQSIKGEPNYNPHTDFNMDGIFSIKDATIIGINWQKHA